MEQRHQPVERGRERDGVGARRHVQGFLPEPVAGEEDLTAVQIHDDEGEHAAEPLDHGRAFGGVEVRQDLGVAGGSQRIAARDQVAPEFVVVVDLAVEHDDEAAVGAHHGLGAVRAVDDRQARVREADPVLRPDLKLIGSAMLDGVEGALQRVPIDGFLADDPGQPAHQATRVPRVHRSPAATRR